MYIKLDTLEKRNTLGNIVWFIMAIFIGIIAEIAMTGREVYQWLKYKETNAFEWDDIERYTHCIALGCIIHYILLVILLCTFGILA